MKSEGLHRNLLLYMVTCNIFKLRPSSSDNNFWPFQYVEKSDVPTQEEDGEYTEDFFFQRAISFCKSNTVRETFGLNLKDVLDMDYGTLLYLEKIASRLDEARAKQMDELDNNIQNGADGNE